MRISHVEEHDGSTAYITYKYFTDPWNPMYYLDGPRNALAASHRTYVSSKQTGDFNQSTAYSKFVYAAPLYAPVLTWTSKGRTYTERTALSRFYPTRCPFISGFSDRTESVQHDQNSLNRAQVECLNKLQESKLNVGVTIAEMPEVARYTTELARDVLLAVRGIRRGSFDDLASSVSKHRKRYLKGRGNNPKGLLYWSVTDQRVKRAPMPKMAKELRDWRPSKARQIWDTVADNSAARWLEFNYAVKPMINDLVDGINVLNHGLGNDYILKASRNLTVPASHVDSHSVADFVGSGKSIYRVRLVARILDYEMSAMKLLGLDNKILIAYEAIPFSFVLDWVLPIGPWLEALNAPKGLEFLFGHYSVKHAVTYTFNTREGDERLSGHSWSSNILAYKRQPYETFPVPMPYVKNPLSGSHVATTLALFRSIFH